MLITNGHLPYDEFDISSPVSLFSLLHNNIARFWDKQSKLIRNFHTTFSSELQEIFVGMTKGNVKERWTIDKIKKSNWYNQPIYKGDDLVKAV